VKDLVTGVAQDEAMVSGISPFPGLAMAQHASLRGMRSAEMRAADAAGRIVLQGTGPPTELARTLFQAHQASPDVLGGLMQLHQAREAYKANATVLRGADAASAALVRWSV
jgi:hypothetical protein